MDLNTFAIYWTIAQWAVGAVVVSMLLLIAFVRVLRWLLETIGGKP